MTKNDSYLKKLTPLVDSGELTDEQLNKIITALSDDETAVAETTDEIKKEVKTKKEKTENPNTISVSTIFTAIGILLIFLGINALIAINWQTVPVSARSILCFIPILITIVLLVLSYIYDNKAMTLYASIIAPLSILATNALITQMFQIQGGSKTYLLVATLSYIPFVILFRNTVSVIFYSLGALYCSIAGFATGNSSAFAVTLMFIGITLCFNIYCHIKEKNSANSQILWLVNLALIFTVVACHWRFYYYDNWFLTFWMYAILALFVTMMIFGKNVISSILNVAALVVLFIATTHAEAASRIYIYGPFNSYDISRLADMIPLILAVLIIIIAVVRFKKLTLNEWFYGVLAVFSITFMLQDLAPLPFIVLNILVILLGIGHIIKGEKEISFRSAIWGTIAILYIIVLRFMTSSMTFPQKSLVLLVVGVLFVVTAIYFRRRMEAKKNEQK